MLLLFARRLPVIPLMSRIFNRRSEISHSTHRTAVYATEKIDEIMSNLNNYYTRYDEMNICLTMAICSRLLAIYLVVVFFVCTFDPPNAELLCLKMVDSRVWAFFFIPAIHHRGKTDTNNEEQKKCLRTRARITSLNRNVFRGTFLWVIVFATCNRCAKLVCCYCESSAVEKTTHKSMMMKGTHARSDGGTNW